MTKNQLYKLHEDKEYLDYGKYLQTRTLFSAQKKFDQLCNEDELQFQIVHQVEELWMKLMFYTLVDVIDRIETKDTKKIMNLMNRVHKIQELMIDQMELLHTMSPFDYQTIRLELGNGSGQESPGFHSLLALAPKIYQSFKKHYLNNSEDNIHQIYAENYTHCDAYVISETLVDFDRLFHRFLFLHFELIERTIGSQAKSLKGRSVEDLLKRITKRFFPRLWEIRSKMTDSWGGSYGEKRESLHQ